MEYPKMLYKGVKPNAFDQLEAEQNTVVQSESEEAQARKEGWHDFAEQAPKAAKAATKADKAAEQAPKAEG